MSNFDPTKPPQYHEIYDERERNLIVTCFCRSLSALRLIGDPEKIKELNDNIDAGKLSYKFDECYEGIHYMVQMLGSITAKKALTNPIAFIEGLNEQVNGMSDIEIAGYVREHISGALLEISENMRTSQVNIEDMEDILQAYYTRIKMARNETD